MSDFLQPMPAAPVLSEPVAVAVAAALTCHECGWRYTATPCGERHLDIAIDPTKHYAIAAVIAATQVASERRSGHE